MNFFKKIAVFSFVIAFALAFSQKITTQEILKPTEGKSLVYFLRSGGGMMINFRMYDNDKFLGAINGVQYLVYECEPGEHLFWAASENRDYVKAVLEADAVYVINAEAQIGMFIAGVNLKPMNPENFADKKLFWRAVKSDTKMISSNPTDDKSENIQKGLEKYEDLVKSNSKKIKFLEAKMKFENADKPSK